MAFNIGIIGTGYVGLVTGNCFASIGNNVWCIDIDESKINKLKQAITPIYEPGLEKLLSSNLKKKTIRFSTDIRECVANCTLIFLCLPTPPDEDGSADIKYVLDVSKTLGELFSQQKPKEKLLIVNKSTVPVGTYKKTTEIISQYLSTDSFVVVSNPEFLREGVAVDDALKPERVIIGTNDEYAISKLTELYSPFVRNGNPIITMDPQSAEVTKYASNAFLATKISFINDLSAYCEIIGADINHIRRGMGSDSRIGNQFIYPGIGYGGSCFPKDVKALLYSARQNGLSLRIVESTEQINQIQLERFINKILKRYNNNLSGLKFAIWGLAFKPNTDDIREAPAHKIIHNLLQYKIDISVYDEEAMETTKDVFGDKINYADDMYSCLENADGLIICTEWISFRTPNFDLMKENLKQSIIFDGRNLFEPIDMKQRGFDYFCVGRT